jgi:hypothetical protein
MIAAVDSVRRFLERLRSIDSECRHLALEEILAAHKALPIWFFKGHKTSRPIKSLGYLTESMWSKIVGGEMAKAPRELASFLRLCVGELASAQARLKTVALALKRWHDRPWCTTLDAAFIAAGQHTASKTRYQTWDMPTGEIRKAYLEAGGKDRIADAVTAASVTFIDGFVLDVALLTGSVCRDLEVADYTKSRLHSGTISIEMSTQVLQDLLRGVTALR